MTLYEYTIVTWQGNELYSLAMRAELNAYGAVGWELVNVAVSPWDYGLQQATFYFKRPLVSNE